VEAAVAVAAAAVAPFQVGLCNNTLASLLPSLFTIVICHVTRVFSEAVHTVFNETRCAQTVRYRMCADYWVLHKCARQNQKHSSLLTVN